MHILYVAYGCVLFLRSYHVSRLDCQLTCFDVEWANGIHTQPTRKTIHLWFVTRMTKMFIFSSCATNATDISHLFDIHSQ